MKLTSNQAKSLLTKLNKAVVGGTVDIDMGPLMSGLGCVPLLTLRELIPETYWLMQVTAGGSPVCEVTAEVYMGELLLEVLG